MGRSACGEFSGGLGLHFRSFVGSFVEPFQRRWRNARLDGTEHGFPHPHRWEGPRRQSFRQSFRQRLPRIIFAPCAHEPGCLLSRPSDTLSSARSGGEGWGEEVHGQCPTKCPTKFSPRSLLGQALALAQTWRRIGPSRAHGLHLVDRLAHCPGPLRSRALRSEDRSGAPRSSGPVASTIGLAPRFHLKLARRRASSSCSNQKL
jgi:hypothetical protein